MKGFGKSNYQKKGLGAGSILGNIISQRAKEEREKHGHILTPLHAPMKFKQQKQNKPKYHEQDERE